MGNAIGRGAAHPLPTVEDDEPDPVAERWPSSDDLQPSTPSFSDHYVMTDSVTAEENDGSSLSREASAGLGMLAQGLAVDWTATTMPACTPREMGMNRSLSFGEISSQLQNSASRSVSPSVLGRTRRRASFTPKVSQQTPPAATPPRTAQAAQGYGTPIHPRTPLRHFTTPSQASSPFYQMQAGHYVDDLNRSLLETMADLRAFSAQHPPMRVLPSSPEEGASNDSTAVPTVKEAALEPAVTENIQKNPLPTDEIPISAEPVLTSVAPGAAQAVLPHTGSTPRSSPRPSPEGSPRLLVQIPSLVDDMSEDEETHFGDSSGMEDEEGDTTNIAMDFDAQLAMLEEQFFTELGQSVNGSATNLGAPFPDLAPVVTTQKNDPFHTIPMDTSAIASDASSTESEEQEAPRIAAREVHVSSSVIEEAVIATADSLERGSVEMAGSGATPIESAAMTARKVNDDPPGTTGTARVDTTPEDDVGPSSLPLTQEDPGSDYTDGIDNGAGANSSHAKSVEASGLQGSDDTASSDIHADKDASGGGDASAAIQEALNLLDSYESEPTADYMSATENIDDILNTSSGLASLPPPVGDETQDDSEGVEVEFFSFSFDAEGKLATSVKRDEGEASKTAAGFLDMGNVETKRYEGQVVGLDEPLEARQGDSSQGQSMGIVQNGNGRSADVPFSGGSSSGGDESEQLDDNLHNLIAAMQQPSESIAQNSFHSLAPDEVEADLAEEIRLMADDSEASGTGAASEVVDIETSSALHGRFGESISSVGIFSPGEAFQKPKLRVAERNRNDLGNKLDFSEFSETTVVSDGLQTQTQVSMGLKKGKPSDGTVEIVKDEAGLRATMKLNEALIAAATSDRRSVRDEEVPHDGSTSNHSDSDRSRIFRKKSAQPEQEKRRVDFSAVSSVTSASSPGTLRGFHATGVLSPVKVDESKLRRKNEGNEIPRPPLFPRKGSDLEGSTRSFGLTESSRNAPSQSAQEDSTHHFDEPINRRWLNSSEIASYNVDESVFALMEDSSSSSLSPTGYDGSVGDGSAKADDASSFGDSLGTPSSHFEAVASHPSSSIWNMLSQSHANVTSPRRQVEERSRPEFVLMPESQGGRPATFDDWGAESFASLGSDGIAATSRRNQSTEMSSIGIKRRGCGRLGRFSSRRKDRTRSLARRQHAFLNDLQNAPGKVDEGSESLASAEGEPASVASTYAGGSLATEIFRGRRHAEFKRSFSSPELRILDETPSEIARELEMSSPSSPLRRQLERALSVDAGFGGVPTKGEIASQDLEPSPEISSPRRRREHSLASRSFLESLNSNGLSVEKHNIQFEADEFGEDENNDETNLEVVLREFSALPSVPHPFVVPSSAPRAIDYIALLRWRQLTARFAHNEVFSVCCKKATSSHLEFGGDLRDPDATVSSGGVALSKNSPFALELQGRLFGHGEVSARFVNRDGLVPHEGDPALPRLTRFITNAVGIGYCSPDPRTLRQPLLVSSATISEASVNELIQAASCFRSSLSELIGSLASFAVETDFGYLPFTLSIKDAVALKSKASSKYRGDLGQVKDVLRGRIIFPDEGSLVCALVKLQQMSGSALSCVSGDEDKHIDMRVIRLKNTFATTELVQTRTKGGLGLPTGYRHILVNVLLDGKFIAEIQFNLLGMFAVLGEDGPVLHRDLRRMEDHLTNEERLKQAELLRSVESKAVGPVSTLRELLCQENDNCHVKNVARTADAASRSQTQPEKERDGPNARQFDGRTEVDAEDSELTSGQPHSDTAIGGLENTREEAEEVLQSDASSCADDVEAFHDAIQGEDVKQELSEESIGSFGEKLFRLVGVTAESIRIDKTQIAEAESGDIAATQLDETSYEEAVDDRPIESSNEDVVAGESGEVRPRVEEAWSQSSTKERLDDEREGENASEGTQDRAAQVERSAADNLEAPPEELAETVKEYIEDTEEPAESLADNVESSPGENSANDKEVSEEFVDALLMNDLSPTTSTILDHGRFLESPSQVSAKSQLTPTIHDSGGGRSGIEHALSDSMETPKAGRTLREIRDLRAVEVPVDLQLRLQPTTSNEGLLAEISTIRSESLLKDVWHSLVRQAVNDIEHNPRDVAALHCLLSIIVFAIRMDYPMDNEESRPSCSALGTRGSKEEILDYLTFLLKRCLAISYQDSAAGMTGWVATVESNSAATHVSDRPLEILHDIGACFAAEGHWTKAENVYRTLVLRSERQLPLYHPTVIASMLDLAACALANNARVDFANKVMSRTSERVSAYLAEMEHSHAMHLQQCLVQNKSGLLMFEIDSGRRALSMLEAFTDRFEKLRHRRLMGLLSPEHDIVLVQRCLLADSLVVLANCWALTELWVTEKRSAVYWRSAFGHYRAVFQAYTKILALDDCRVAAAAYGCARCLRELGKVSEALQVLSPVAKALSHSHAPPTRTQRQTLNFLPLPVVTELEGVDRRMQAAQCQWLLAVLTAEHQPDDDGRTKALKCLHKASIALRHILDSRVADDPRRTECIRLLQQVEEEARRIFHPLRRAAASTQPHRSDRRA